jgi:DNA-binding LytR/AlgR family response regulator
MKYIKIHDLKGNTILVNADNIIIIAETEGGTKTVFQDGYYGICKETIEELEKLIYDT